MEEEDDLALLDYRTPKGQLIKFLEQKMKKPEIDDSLGKVLDQFTQLTNEQTTFLENGIFQMNFAEDALLLQSCGQYYAKRVDKLWEDLLQFHTRMVKYEETSAKHCTDSGKKQARKLELEKLEERLNRGKRKKIRLTEPDTDTPQNGNYVFDIDQDDGLDLFDRATLLQEETEEPCVQVVVPFEHNFEMFDDWHEIHRLDEIERQKRGSVVVSQYNQQKYRLKHYCVPNGDEIVYDLKDPEEFNTREGRLISAHHIRHLFEYNDRCLLPDEHFTIAKLRFAYVLKKKWLVQNKIDPDAPYETYKEEYEKYQRDYFENEKRKIQNMPQRNSEDLLKFYKVLAKKEQLARQAQEKLRKLGVKNLPEITFQSLILDPLKEGYQGDYDPYIPVDDETQAEGSAPTHDGDHEVELSNLFVDLPNLPDSSAEAAEKLRSDSGYFDGGFADDESDHEDHIDASVPGTDTPFEFDKDNTEKIGEETTLDKTNESVAMETDAADESSIQVSGDSELAEKDTTDGNTTLETSAEESSTTPNDEAQDPAISSSPENAVISTEQSDSSSTDEQHLASIYNDSMNREITDEQNLASIDNESMNRELKEFVKLGTVDENFNYSILENSVFKKNDDMIMILYNKEEDAELINGDSQLDDDVVVGKQKSGKSKKEEKTRDKKQDKEKAESKKRKLEERQDDDPPPKRRKLSQKQIEKLRKSLIEPVKEPKWDSFFSMNYQTEAGEGEISRIDYESASEDEDDTPDDHTEDQDNDKIEEPNDLNVTGYHSDHEGSHTSGHCRPETPPLPLSQDSGIDIMDISTNSISDCPPITEKEAEPLKDTTSNKEAELIVELGNIDLIAELSKNTGISREEIAKQQPEKPELSQYEQQREKVRERVAEWKEHIVPKLKKLDEHDFDIHEYGSKVMDSMNVNESKRFSDLVTGQSSAEVVRFFISSLQLANTMNVEICGAKRGELSNDSFELKLLSKERYHEHLQEYQAPSEESLGEKLKKIKQIRMQNKMQAKQSHTKRSRTDDVTANATYSQQSIPQKSVTIRTGARSNKPSANSSNNQQCISLSVPRKKIKILNYNVINSSNQQAFQCQQLPISRPSLNYDFQQPSTSWQADTAYQQNQPESPISDLRSPLAHTPTRSSIDSGFMPSCDEDTFLDQFDHLQHTSDAQLRSTPVKPRKVLRVSFARNTNF